MQRRAPLSVATKVFLSFAVVLITFGAVSIYGVVQMRAIGRRLGLLSTGYFPLAQVAARLETFQKERELERDRLMEERDPHSRRALVQLARVYFARQVRDKIAAARKLVATARGAADESDREALDDIEARLNSIAERFDQYDAAAEQLYTALETGIVLSGNDVVRKLKRVELRVDREMAQLVSALGDRIDHGVADAEAKERRTALATVALSLFAILVGLLATAASQRLLAPIRALTEAARGVSRGEFAGILPDARAEGDEVATLTREFKAMAESLREREARLKAQGEALLRSERLATVGRMAAQVAHEIRNPLSSIGLNAELMADALASGDRSATTLLTAISQEVDRLTEITEQYLRFARMPKPQLAPVELNDLLGDLLDFHAEELATARIEVQRVFESPPRVSGDAAQLRQAFVNLIRNAREAMSAGGTLTITTRSEGGAAIVAIADTGVGIDAALRDKLFEPFFTTKERGTGLGLALTQQILQEHGGAAQVESEPGKGTVFVIRLPASV